ncbi:MAG: hypothetical protein Q7J31_04370 [Syntrophales bacterium]|nr:hypothetical protein [Syntrophales bacterium]
MNILEVFNNAEIIDASLNETKLYYRPLDPGSYLYRQIESFEKLPILSFRLKGEILTYIKSLRFLVANAPRNDKIQSSQIMEYDFDSKFSKDFIELVYVTLSAWNMNSRGAKLQEFEVFKKSIIKNKRTFYDLSSYSLKDIEKPIVRDLLEKLINNIDLVAESKPPLVTFSKTMHFFLPDLVGPIDRTYTMRFFYNNTNVPKTIANQFKRFMDIETEYCNLAKKFKLAKFKDGVWNRTIPKIIDNMIIGFLRLNGKS